MVVKAVRLQVVDERMWGDEDKPEPDQKPGEEQHGKDAPAQVLLPTQILAHARSVTSKWHMQALRKGTRQALGILL